MGFSSFREPSSLAGVVDALAGPGFGRALIGWIGGMTRVEYCAVYTFGADRAELLTAASRDGSDLALHNGRRFAAEAFWRRDPTVATALAAHGACGLARIDTRRIADPVLRRDFYTRPRVGEKVFVYGRRRQHLIGVSVLRPEDAGAMPECERAALAASSELLLALIAQHADSRPGAAARLLATVPAIESRLASLGVGLTARETQVTARLMHGLTMEGVALDLGIRPETVVTYRKRAFARLGVATRHELLERVLGAL